MEMVPARAVRGGRDEVLALCLTVALALLFPRPAYCQPAHRSGLGLLLETVASGNLTQPIDVLWARMNQHVCWSALKHAAESAQYHSEYLRLIHATGPGVRGTQCGDRGSTRGLHQQNNEIEQAATAVNEMTSAVEEVARNAVSTSEASSESGRTALHGREQVRQTVDSITSLADDVTHTASEVEQLAGQVRDISKVLDVIRSIAEQTNLLALNAPLKRREPAKQGAVFCRSGR